MEIQKALQMIQESVEQLNEAIKILGTKTDEKIIPMPKAEKPVAEKKAPASKGRTAKVKPPVVEVQEPVKEDVDPIVALVDKATKDMTNEEIAEVLVDIGVSASGKREALVAKVLKAVRDNKLELENDDDSDDDSDDEELEVQEFVVPITEDEIGDVNDTSREDMTEERKEAIVDFIKEVKNSFKTKELTRAEVVEWLNNIYGTEFDMKERTDAEIQLDYAYVTSLMIDDAGELNEASSPYTVNGKPFCCGSMLIHNDETNSYICELCEEEYEDSDEE